MSPLLVIVGGSHDGEVYAHPGRVLHLLKPVSLPEFEPDPGMVSIDDASFAREVYYRETVRTANRSHEFWRYGGLSLDAALEKVFETYASWRQALKRRQVAAAVPNNGAGTIKPSLLKKRRRLMTSPAPAPQAPALNLVTVDRSAGLPGPNGR